MPERLAYWGPGGIINDITYKKHRGGSMRDTILPYRQSYLPIPVGLRSV